jgi:hypothetical protein
VAQQVITSSTFVSNLGNLVSFIEPIAGVTDPAYKA